MKVTIVIIENNMIDIAILDIGDGVLEVKCKGGDPQTNNNIDKITKLCSGLLKDANLTVDELVIVGEEYYVNENRKAIENVFGKTARVMSNLS